MRLVFDEALRRTLELLYAGALMAIDVDWGDLGPVRLT